MTSRGSDLPKTVAAALPPAAAALAVTLLVLGRSAWGSAQILPALAAGLAAAAAVALPLAAPLVRQVNGRRRRLAELSSRLADLEEGHRAVPSVDLVRLVESLEVPGSGLDEGLEEALAELEAALRDEERLRERRREAEASVRETLRSGRALSEGAPDAFPGLDRLPGLLDRLSEAHEGVREAAATVHQGAIAGEEVSTLLSKHARTGREASTRAGRGADDLEKRVVVIEKLLRKLAARSREIGQVLIVLNDITEQANLLALNAGIIAAQAGHHGKGFGVVADEMRNLSERASSSTKETEILAQTLQDDVAQTGRAMEGASEDVRDLRVTLAEASESTGILADLGDQGLQTARNTVKGTETHTTGLRDLATCVARALEERDTLVQLEGDVLRPTRRLLQDAVVRLEGEWQAGALRESLRGRLENAVSAVRERRGRERSDRRRLEEGLHDLRESGRRWADDLEETKRREHLVSEVARDIRDLAAPSVDR